MISQGHLRQESRRSLPPCIARRNRQALKHLGLAQCAARLQQQSEREQIRQALLSDLELADELSVRSERWATAVQSHGASQVIDLSASSVEPTQACEVDEHLGWLKSVLHQVDGMAGTVLQVHLIQGQTIKDLAQVMRCSRSALRLHLHEGVELLQQLAQRDGL